MKTGSSVRYIIRTSIPRVLAVLVTRTDTPKTNAQFSDHSANMPLVNVHQSPGAFQDGANSQPGAAGPGGGILPIPERALAVLAPSMEGTGNPLRPKLPAILALHRSLPGFCHESEMDPGVRPSRSPPGDGGTGQEKPIRARLNLQ